ncbi:MAG TPA: alpha/beta hydrolase [Mycobacteriales bacterium]|nr:alpha/beta hydrolase [Mycobacteriales bacterium]
MRRLVSAVAAGAALGAVAQRLAEARDRRRFPMPGRLVEVDGTALHVVVEGSGPVVLIDSGLGGSCLEWAAVARDLAHDFTVVRYDRPGFGWSPGSTCDRSAVAAAQRIRGLVAALGLTAPVLLVGHSLGGLHVRLVASLYPDLVRGLVLVDPSHEDMLDDPSAARNAAVMNKVMSAFAVTAPLGTPRLVGRLYTRMVTSAIRATLDDEMRTSMHRSTLLTACSVAGLRGAVAEMNALPVSLQQAKGMGPLPDVPVTLITAGASPRTPSEEKVRAVIRELHESVVTSVPQGRLVVASESGHLVPIDEPDLVVQCIRETADAPVASTLSGA